MPIAVVLAEHDATFVRLGAVVEEMSDELLADAGSFPWLDGDTVGDAIVSGRHVEHVHEEHEPAVRAWLDGSSKRQRRAALRAGGACHHFGSARRAGGGGFGK